MKKLFFMLVVLTIVLTGCSKKSPGAGSFGKEVEKYISSGDLFSSKWNDVKDVTFSKSLGNGCFLAAVRFNRGMMQYYHIRSFYFPIPFSDPEFISELGKRRMGSFAPIILESSECLAFGWITFEDLSEHGTSLEIIGRAGFFQKGKEGHQWEFAKTHYSNLTGRGREGIRVYKELSAKYVKLGPAEKDCLEDCLAKLSPGDYKLMYNQVIKLTGGEEF